MRIGVTATKLGIFAVVMMVMLAFLIVVFGQLRFGSDKKYSAEFVSASGIKSGEIVRVAGVDVGRVGSVSANGDGKDARIEFTVDSSVPVNAATRASIRYQNLIGDRYLELSEGPGDTVPLRPGSTIPVSRTAPALDLDALIGGFRPLLKALDPKDVNTISTSLVKVFQGEGGSIATILQQTGQVTNALADRDDLIGSVIGNLNELLGVVDEHNDQFDDAIDKLQLLVSGLGRQSTGIANAVAGLSDGAGSVSSLLDQSRPAIRDDVAGIRDVSTLVNNDSAYVDRLLGELPESYRRLANLGASGAFFPFYLCDVNLKINGAKGDPLIIKLAAQGAGRCSP